MDPRIYGGTRALRTFDISNPDSPRELALHATEWINCMALRIQGDRLYATCHGISTFDIEDRDHPRWIGDGHAGTWYDIAIAPGQRLVVAADKCGMAVLDFSEHFLPRALGGVTLRGRALKAAPMILGDIVYLPIGAEKIGSATTFHGGLAIVDVADPALPEIVGTVPWGVTRFEVSLSL